MAAGTIDDSTLKGDLPRVPVHIFVEEKAIWHDLADDGGPRYARHEPEFQENLDRSEGFPGANVIDRSWDPIVPKRPPLIAVGST